MKCSSSLTSGVLCHSPKRVFLLLLVFCFVILNSKAVREWDRSTEDQRKDLVKEAESIYLQNKRGKREERREGVVGWLFCNGWRGSWERKGFRKGYEMVGESNRIPLQFTKVAS